MYVARMPGLKVIRDGKTVALNVGDQIPEASSLPTFDALLRMGWIVVEGADMAKDKQTPETVVTETAPVEAVVAESALPASRPASAGPVPRNDQKRR